MKRRRVLISIDDATALLRDYVGQDIPADARPLQLMLRPTEAGRLGIMMDSDDWAVGQPPLDVKFELRRFHSL